MNTCYCCGEKLVTVNTVQNTKDEETYRLKRCKKCGHEEYTVEFEVEDNRKFRDEWNKWIRMRTNEYRNKDIKEMND